MPPDISVIMPVYNAAPYVGRAIQSILAQSFGKFELIILNDGSNDNSDEIIRQYADPRIVYYPFESNEGYVTRLNFGIKHAKARYIARMDADDISFKKRFELQFNLLEQNPDIQICGCSVIEVDEEEKTRKLRRVPSSYFAIKLGLAFDNVIVHPSVLMRKEFLVSHHLKYLAEYAPSEDYKLWCDAILLGKIMNIREPLMYYRVHKGQISQTCRTRSRDNSHRTMHEYLEKIMGESVSDFHFNLHLALKDHDYQAYPPEKLLSWLTLMESKLKGIDRRRARAFFAGIWLRFCNNGLVSDQSLFKAFLRSRYSLHITISKLARFVIKYFFYRGKTLKNKLAKTLISL